MPVTPTITILDNTIQKPEAKNLEAIYPIVVDGDHVLYFDDETRPPKTIGNTAVYFHRLTLKLGIGEVSYPLEFEENEYTSLWTIKEIKASEPGEWYLYLAADQQGWGYLSGQMFLSKMFPNYPTNMLRIPVSESRILFALRMANVTINARYLGQTEMSYSVVITDPYLTNIRVDNDTIIYEDLNPGATIPVAGIPTPSEYLYLNVSFSRFRKPLFYDPTKTFEVQSLPAAPHNYRVYIASNQSEWDLVNPLYKGQMLFIDKDYDTGDPLLFPRYIGSGIYLDALYIGEVSMAFRTVVSPYDSTVTGHLCNYCKIVRDVEGDRLNWAAPDDPHSYGELIFVDNKQPTRVIGGTVVNVDGLSNLLSVFHYRPCLHAARYTTPRFSYETLVTGDYNIYLASDQKAWDQLFGEGIKGNLFLTDPKTDFVMNTEFFKERSGFWYSSQIDPYKTEEGVPVTSTVKLKEVFPLKYGIDQSLHAIYLTSARIIMSEDGTGIARVIFNNKYSGDPRLTVDDNNEIVFNDEAPWTEVDGYRVVAKGLTLKRTSFYFRVPLTKDLTGLIQSSIFESSTYNIYISGIRNWSELGLETNYEGVLFLVDATEDPDKDWFPHIQAGQSAINAKYVGQATLSVETVVNSYTGDTTYRITSAKILEGSDPRLSLGQDNDIIFTGGTGATEDIGFEPISVELLRLKLPQDSYRPVILFDFKYLRGLSLGYEYFDAYTTRYDTAIATLKSEWSLVHADYPGKMFLRPTWAALSYYNNSGMDPSPGSTNPRTEFPVALYSLGSFSWVFKTSEDPYTGTKGHRIESVKTNDFYKQNIPLGNPDSAPRGFFIDHYGNAFYDKELDDTYYVEADWLSQSGGEWDNPQYLHLPVFHYQHHFLRPTDLIEALGEGVFEERKYNIFLGSNQRDWLYQVSNGRNYKGKMFLAAEEPDGNDLLRIPYADPDTGSNVYLEAEFMGSVDIHLSKYSVKASYQLSYDALKGDLIYADVIDPVLEIDATEVDVSGISLLDAPGRYRLPLLEDTNNGTVGVVQELGGTYNVFLTPDKSDWSDFQYGYRASMFLSTDDCDPVNGIRYYTTDSGISLKAIKVGSVDFEWNCQKQMYKYRVIKMDPIEIMDKYSTVTPDDEWIRESPGSQVPGEQERYPQLWCTRLGPGRPRPPLTAVSAARENEIIIREEWAEDAITEDSTVKQIIRIGVDNTLVEEYSLIGLEDGQEFFVLGITGDGSGSGDVSSSVDHLDGNVRSVTHLMVSPVNGLTMVSYDLGGNLKSPKQVSTAVTASSHYIDLTNIAQIRSVSFLEHVPPQCSIFYAFSFDRKKTWKIFISGAWKDIAQYTDVHIWQFKNKDNAWEAASENNLLSCLRQAMEISFNQSPSLYFTDLAKDAWQRIDVSLERADVVFGLVSDGESQPSVRGITVNAITREQEPVSRSITISSENQVDIENRRGLIRSWEWDNVNRGHFEGVTKYLDPDRSLYFYAFGRVGIPCKEVGYEPLTVVRFRNAGAYSGDYLVLDALVFSEDLWMDGVYSVLFGDYNRLVTQSSTGTDSVVFFTKLDPNLIVNMIEGFTLSVLGKVGVEVTYEEYSTLRPLFVFDMFGPHSEMLNVTDDKYDIEYRWNGPDPTWLPGVWETQILDSPSVYDHIRLGPVSYRPPLFITAVGSGPGPEA
jgi:hypothetical protein